MSADKYPCIFSRQMETIVYIAVKSPKISLYPGKIKMYFFTAYYLIKLVMSIK